MENRSVLCFFFFLEREGVEIRLMYSHNLLVGDCSNFPAILFVMWIIWALVTNKGSCPDRDYTVRGGEINNMERQFSCTWSFLLYSSLFFRYSHCKLLIFASCICILLRLMSTRCLQTHFLRVVSALNYLSASYSCYSGIKKYDSDVKQFCLVGVDFVEAHDDNKLSLINHSPPQPDRCEHWLGSFYILPLSRWSMTLHLDVVFKNQRVRTWTSIPHWP